MANNVLSYEVAGIDRLSKILDKIADATERLNGKLDKLDGKVARVVVAAENAEANKKIDETDRKRRNLDGKNATVKVNAKVDKGFAETTVLVDRFLTSLRTFALPAGILAAAPTLLEVGGAAVQMTGALGIVPAIAVAAGAALGTAKVATAGFGDALKALNKGDMAKFNEQLAKMAPNAQAVLREYAGLQPAFQATKVDVQTAFWAGMAGEIKPLANIYIPMLRSSMVDYAWAANEAILTTTGFLKSVQASSAVSTILDNGREAMSELVGVGRDLVSIFLDVAAVGSEFLPGLASGLAECAKNAADFVHEARETGKLREWISNGLSILGSLAQAVINLGVFFHNLWTAAGTDADTFMTKFRDVTGVVADWSGSVQGQSAIADFFQKLRDVVSAVLPLLGAVGVALFQAFNLIAPVLPSVAQALTDVFNASGPLIDPLSQLAISIIPPLAAAISFLAPVIGPMVAAMTVAKTATMLWTVALGIGAAATKAYAIATTIGQVAQLAYTVVTQAGTAKLIAWAAAQWLMNAAMSANPIGLVVLALAALVAGLVLAWNHSETFRNIVMGAWQGIKDAVAAAWEFLQGVFAAIPGALAAAGGFFSGLWQGVVDGWNSLVSAVWEPMKQWFTVDLPAMWQGLVQIVTDVWNGIVDAVKLAVTIILTIILTPLLIFINTVFPGGLEGFKAVWIAIWGAVRDYLQSWWVFIQGIWQAAVDFVTVVLPAAFQAFVNVATALWEGLKDTLQRWWAFVQGLWLAVTTFLSAVFTVAFNAFMAAVTAVWDSLKAMLQGWWSVISALWNAIISFLSGIFSPAFNAMRDVVVAAWNTLRDGISTVWNWIRDNIFNPIVNFVTKTIPDAFNTGVAAIRRLWDGVKAALRDPIQAAINVVYNDGIVAVWNKVADLVGLSTKLTPYTLPAFAAGGPITGGVAGKDSVILKAMPGEFMFSKPAVDAAGGLGNIAALHDALTGKTRGGDGSIHPAGGTGGGLPGFAPGGSVAGATASGSASTVAMGSATATTDYFGWLDALGNAVSSLVGRLASNPWAQLVVGFGKKLIEAPVNYLTEKIKSWIASLVSLVGGGAPPPGSGAVVAQVMQAAQAFGWGDGAQWAALSWIISHESGWNPNAQNPTSTAYGLFQFLNGTWASTGVPKTSNPYQQAVAGMRYISSRYHDPIGAQAFWQSHGWYANGGVIDRPTFGLLGESGPEVVLPLSRPDRARQLADQAGLTASGELHVHVTTGPTATAEDIIRSAMFRARLDRMSGRYVRGRS